MDKTIGVADLDGPAGLMTTIVKLALWDWQDAPKDAVRHVRAMGFVGIREELLEFFEGAWCQELLDWLEIPEFAPFARVRAVSGGPPPADGPSPAWQAEAGAASAGNGAAPAVVRRRRLGGAGFGKRVFYSPEKWAEVRDVYVAGGVTAQDVATQFGVSLAAVRTRCARGGWGRLRVEAGNTGGRVYHGVAFWAEVLEEYVAGSESLAGLAARRGLPKGTVHGQAMRGGWVTKRAVYRRANHGSGD